ncbi:TPA: hypothetical protein DCX16_01885 [bacterium]|nr:hypothetical protein [bacterium]
MLKTQEFAIIKIKMVFILLLLPGLLFSAPIDLKIGARPQGMGGAFTGIADDSNAIYNNPAGLSLIKTGEISFMHTSPLDAKDTYIDWLCISQPVGRASGIGFGLLYKWCFLEEGPNRTKNKMSEGEAIISFASSMKNTVMYGASIKMLSLSSKTDKGKGIGFDLGLLYKGDFPLSNFSLGFMFRNLASQIKDESHPKEIKIGACKRFFNERLILSGDIGIKKDVNKKETNYQTHIGIEINPIKNIFLRTGLDRKDITAGFGFLVKNIQFDYSFLSDRDYSLPNTHRFGINFRF